MKCTIICSRIAWIVCILTNITGYIYSAQLQTLQATDIKARMQAEDTQVSGVKEIFIIPITEVTVTKAQVGAEVKKALEREKEKKPGERVAAASKKAEELLQEQRGWRVILAQPAFSRTQRILRLVPFTHKPQPKWQILHQSVGKTVFQNPTELEGYAYKMLAKLTYNGLSKTSTQFEKYVSEYLISGESAPIRPLLPRIIVGDKAYFFIPVIADVNPAKLTSNAKRSWFGNWARYATASIGTNGALSMDPLASGMTLAINDDDKSLIQNSWKSVLVYVNFQIDILAKQWEVRKSRLQLEPEENRWDDFAGRMAISSDVNAPTSILDPNAPQPFQVNGKQYESAQEYYVLTSQDCAKKDISVKKDCLIRKMFDALYYKLKYSTASRTVLRATGSDTILLYNTEDALFGVGVDKKGQNQVGRMLMFFRANIAKLDDGTTLDGLWNVYTPSMQEWGKHYSQEAFRAKLRYAIYRFHVTERVLRLLGYQR